MQNDHVLDVSLENELQVVPQEKQTEIQVVFDPIFKEMNKAATTARNIKVSDETQVTQMKAARELRLQLVRIRTDADKKRINLKENYLLMSRAIDGIYNVIKAHLKPLEVHLQQQEDFIKIKKETARLKLIRNRIDMLSKYNAPEPFFIGLDLYTEDEFSEFIATAKEVNDARIAKEKADAKKETARIKAEEQTRAEDLKRLIAAEKAIVAAAKKEKISYIRLGQMPQARIKGEHIYIGETALILAEKLADIDDKEFKSVLAAYTAANDVNEKYRQQQDKRATDCYALGLSISPDSMSFTKDDFNVSFSEIRTYTDDAWNHLIKRISDEMDIRQKAEKERLVQLQQIEDEQKAIKAEKARLIGASDKEQLKAFMNDLDTLKLPQPKSREAKEIVSKVDDKIDEAIHILKAYLN